MFFFFDCDLNSRDYLIVLGRRIDSIKKKNMSDIHKYSKTYVFHRRIVIFKVITVNVYQY